MRQYKIGYTQGVFDMYHIGHLNLLKNAKKMCDYLIVGVNSDELTHSYKYKYPVIGEDDRLAIIESVRFVDKAFLVSTLDKMQVYQFQPFDAIFIGSDWKGNDRWAMCENQFRPLGVDVVYLPHTDGISSSSIKAKIP